MAAYTKVYRKNKKPYIAQMNGDTLEVIEKGKTIPGFHIKQGERILESSYSENMDDMVNRVYVYNSSNKKIGILTNTRWANMYGIFQSAITVDSGNGKQEAMNELKGISKNASLTSTGDYRCVSGLGVIIEDSRTGLKGRFWIESDSHEWKNGSYTMKLDLEFKNIMDTQEEDEEQTSSSLSDLSESSALEDVLNQARSWIGIGENPPGSNHNEITVLYGMDAAWCCMFIWACFNKSGHADLFMGGAKEAYCFNVRDYYQARGKWGSTPKKGALVIYGGQGHIGIVESVNSAGGYTSIEGNYGDDVKRRDSHQNVLGFCYIDYPVTKSAEGSDEVISGTSSKNTLFTSSKEMYENKIYESYLSFSEKASDEVRKIMDYLPKTYYVEKDESGDFVKLSDAIVTATKYMDSVVYLGDGTWDLIEEFGSDFFNNATGGGAPRSPVRGLLLKNRIHIIGSSKSKIICNYTGDNAVIKKWFSVFNSDIYGFTLENITIEASNIRYIIHDERDSDTDSYINRYINCHFKFDNSDNDTPGRTAQCIGGGLGIDGYIDINGGVFESIDTTKTGHICVVSYHNSAGANAKNHISIKNTYLKALGYFRINSYGESTEITECEITNCSMGRSVLIGHETGGSNMNINVTQWNNEIR